MKGTNSNNDPSNTNPTFDDGLSSTTNSPISSSTTASDTSPIQPNSSQLDSPASPAPANNPAHMDSKVLETVSLTPSAPINQFSRVDNEERKQGQTSDTILPQDSNNKADDQVVTTSYVPKKYGGGKVIATIFGIFLIAGAVVAGVTMVQNQQLRVGYAWDCSKYNFEISQAGDVRILNGSTRNEPSQKAEVYIDNSLAATLDVPALAPGTSADLGHVNVPSGAFSWRIKGTVDCEDSGSYTEQNTPTPQITSTATPVPSSPTPQSSSTPTPGSTSCKVELSLSDTAVCWHDAKNEVPVGWKIVSLPSTGGPYYLQTDWYIVQPTAGPHHYEVTGPVSTGQTGTINGGWPGVVPGQTQTSENHYGLNVVDKNGNIMFSNCSDGMDYYWTPYVCPAPTPTVTSSVQNSGQCSAVIAYDTEWNQLNVQTLSQLEAGDMIYLTVSGTASTGSFDKARFTVNGVLRPETTKLKPGTNNIFYDEYQIPTGMTTFTVGAQIHHTLLDWF